MSDKDIIDMISDTLKEIKKEDYEKDDELFEAVNNATPHTLNLGKQRRSNPGFYIH